MKIRKTCTSLKRTEKSEDSALPKARKSQHSDVTRVLPDAPLFFSIYVRFRSNSGTQGTPAVPIMKQQVSALYIFYLRDLMPFLYFPDVSQSAIHSGIHLYETDFVK